jgi:hypothetical protein
MVVESVTVIVPHYNRPERVRDALLSIRDQTVKPAEILLVDDSSSPENRDTLRDLSGLATRRVMLFKMGQGGEMFSWGRKLEGWFPGRCNQRADIAGGTFRRHPAGSAVGDSGRWKRCAGRPLCPFPPAARAGTRRPQPLQDPSENAPKTHCGPADAVLLMIVRMEPASVDLASLLRWTDEGMNGNIE